MKIFGKRKYKGNDVVNRAYGIDENKIREDSQKVMGRAVAEVNKWLDELKKKQDKEIERLIKEIAKAKENEREIKILPVPDEEYYPLFCKCDCPREEGEVRNNNAYN